MKKLSLYKKFLLIYVAVLVVIVAAVDIFVWSKLSDYEKTMDTKISEQEANNAVMTVTPSEGLEADDITPTPVPTSTPTPTPTPEMEKVIIELSEGSTLYIDEEEADLTAFTFTEVQSGCFDILYTFSEEYSEYADIETKVEIPALYRYEFEVPKDAMITVKDSFTQNVELTSTTDENGTVIYNCGFVSKTDNYDTIKNLAFEAIKKYALFCANDAQASELAPYFPAGSEYLQVISSLDNSWYMKHSGLPTYSEETVLDYMGYSDSLVYIEISMKQTILSSITGTYVETVIEHPVWFVKLDGEWKIGAIEF